MCHGRAHSISGQGQAVQNGWHRKFRDGNTLAREEIIGAKVIELRLNFRYDNVYKDPGRVMGRCL